MPRHPLSFLKDKVPPGGWGRRAEGSDDIGRQITQLVAHWIVENVRHTRHREVANTRSQSPLIVVHCEWGGGKVTKNHYRWIES